MPERISWSNFPELRDYDKFDYGQTSGPATEVTFTLTTASNITWWKAIKLLDRTTGVVIEERALQDANHGPVSFTVPDTQVDSVKFVLAKAKLFGVHTDMYEVYELREKLGWSISLNWKSDGPDNVWAAFGSFFSDVVTGVAHGVVTVMNFVITVVETVIGWIADAVAWVVGLILSIPIIGRFIALVIGYVTFVVGFIVNTVLEAAFGVLGIVGVRQPMKLLRLVVVVQQDAFGTPVTTIDEVRVQLDFLIKLFQERANIRVIPGGPFRFASQFDWSPIPAEEFVIFEDRPSSPQTLDVRCGENGYRDDFGYAGANFQIKINNLFWGNGRRLINYGGPLVVFAVRSYIPAGSIACSLGPAHQYVTVRFTNSQYSLLAHEVGHACALIHAGGTTNLMISIPPSPMPPGHLGLWLTNEQVFLLRASPRCVLS